MEEIKQQILNVKDDVCSVQAELPKPIYALEFVVVEVIWWVPAVLELLSAQFQCRPLYSEQTFQIEVQSYVGGEIVLYFREEIINCHSLKEWVFGYIIK